MDPPLILLTSNCPHPPLISPDFATMDSSISIPEQPIPSIVPHQVNFGTDCLWLASSSTVAHLQSTTEDNFNCITDFACMDGGNLVKMISAEDTTPKKNDNKPNDITPKKRSNDGIVPCEGMEFTSLDEFETYYYAYALSEGFTVRIKKTLKFDRTNIFRYRHYVCSCAGFSDVKKSNDEVDEDEEKTIRKTLTRRSGCPVTITVSKNKCVWKVRSVNNKHNHLLVSPNSRNHLRQRGGIPSIAKKLVEKFSESNLPIGKVSAILNCDAEINISQRSCWNHRRDLRRKNLDRGDAEAVLQYFRKKQLEDGNFYYSIQTDDEDRLVNFFWIDSTTQQYYERFGDVVVFDTTYKTNKYSMPLANFVGVNNHCQSIMFGCALLQNEEEETFVWLFQTWLEAMKKNGSSTQYEVSNSRNPHEIFLVTINVESKEVSCQCHLFEFKGILCRHILYIYNKKDVDEIPSRYILPRWTKRAAEGIPIPIFKKDEEAIARDLWFNNTISQLRRYLHVSREAFDTIIETLDMTLEKVSSVQETKGVSNVQETIEVGSEGNAKDSCHLLVGDPHISKTKGRKKESVNESKRGRLRSGFEVGMEHSKRSKRQCKDCGEFGHYSSTCERRKQAKI